MKIRAIILLVVILTSCDNFVRFEVPQPEGQSNMKLIPKKLIGQYSSLSDSSNLFVTPDQIIKTSISYLAVLKSELDSSEHAALKTDTAFSVIESNMADHVTIINNITVRGDSVFEHIVYKDAIFNASRGDILRKFKGYYFLNRQTSINNWYVTKLTKTKKGLALGTVSPTEDIKNLRELTETTSDSAYNFNPTRQQFKKFVKTKGFSNEDFYVRTD